MTNTLNKTSETRTAVRRKKNGTEECRKINPLTFPFLQPFSAGNLKAGGPPLGSWPALAPQSMGFSKALPPGTTSTLPRATNKAPRVSGAGSPGTNFASEDRRGSKRARTSVLMPTPLNQSPLPLQKWPLDFFDGLPTTPGHKPPSELSVADRRMQKLIRNRESAKLHRDRQKHRLANLEKKTQEQEKTIWDLEKQIEVLKKEKGEYERQLQGCQCRKGAAVIGSLNYARSSLHGPPSGLGATSNSSSDASPDSSPGHEGGYDSSSEFHISMQEEDFPSLLPVPVTAIRTQTCPRNQNPQPQSPVNTQSLPQGYHQLDVPKVAVKPEFEKKPSIELPPDLTEEDWQLLEDEFFLPSVESDLFQEMLEQGESEASLCPPPTPRNQQRRKSTCPPQPSLQRSPSAGPRLLSTKGASLGVSVLFAVCCLLSLFSGSFDVVHQQHMVVEVPSSLMQSVPELKSRGSIGPAVYQSQDLVPYSSSTSPRRSVRHSRAGGRVLSTFEDNSELAGDGIAKLPGVKDRGKLSTRPWLWRSYVRKYHKAPWEYAKALDLYKSRELQLANPLTLHAHNVAPASQPLDNAHSPTKALVAAHDDTVKASGMELQMKIFAANMALAAAALASTLPSATTRPSGVDTSYMFCPQAYGTMSTALSAAHKENSTSPTGGRTTQSQELSSATKTGHPITSESTDEYMVLLVPSASLDWTPNDNYVYGDKDDHNKSSYSWVEIGCKVIAARLVPGVHFSFN